MNTVSLTDRARERVDRWTQTQHQEDQPSKPILVRASALAEGIRPPSWLVHGILETHSLGVLWGAPGAGKSFIALDLAASIAAGVEWHGIRTTQCPVVYVNGEGFNGIARRLKGWSIARGENLPDSLSVSRQAVPMLDAAPFARLHKEIEELPEPPGLIIIDTLHRNFGGGDENSTSDMGAFVQACDMLRTSFNASVLVVHHSGHAGDRARGSSSLKAAVDVELGLTRDQSDPHAPSILANHKCKDGEPFEPMAFRLRQVDLGILDDQEQPVTSAVMDQVDVPEQKPKAAGIGKNQSKALAVLQQIDTEHRRRLSDGNHSPAGARVRTEVWKQACQESGIDRRRFAEIRTSLENSGLIQIEGAGMYVRPVSGNACPSDVRPLL